VSVAHGVRDAVALRYGQVKIRHNSAAHRPCGHLFRFSLALRSTPPRRVGRIFPRERSFPQINCEDVRQEVSR